MEGGTTANTAVQAIQTLLNSLTSELTFSTIVSYLVIGISASLGLVLMWFGIRKLVRMVMTAFKSGRFRL